MISLLLILVFITSVSFRKGEKISLIDKENSQSINGFFVLIVFISHFLPIYSGSSTLDQKLLSILTKYLGQFMVTTFFAFSGYGICHSIITKKNYISEKFTNRFRKLIIAFAIGILIYIIYNLLLGNSMTLNIIVLSFLGWENIGNSNWFMFITFIIYLYTYLIFKNEDGRIEIKIFKLTLSLIITAYFISIFKEDFWINTLLCFPLGMIIRRYESFLNSKFSNKKHVLSILISFIVSLLLLYKVINRNWIGFNFLSILFICIILLLSNFVDFKSPVLKFFGQYTFEIYLYQRISFGLSTLIFKEGTFTFIFIVSLFIVILISIAMRKVTDSVYKKIWNPDSRIFSIW